MNDHHLNVNAPDFSNIRPVGGDKRHGFEEFVCQLASLFQPESAKTFHRIEGAGGDGGVECFWELTDGGEIGYQAKYFLESGEIGWDQIDQSVKTALKVHPKLTQYFVVLPCDLTGHTAKTGKGRPPVSGLEHWERRSKRWETWAAEHTMTVTFEKWTKSHLLLKLTDLRPEIAGLRYYWFNLAAWTPSWFKTRLSYSIDNLGERYHPDDHVDVDIGAVLDALISRDRIKKTLLEQIKTIKNVPFLDSRLSNSSQEDMRKAEKSIIRPLLDVLTAYPPEFDNCLSLGEWKKQAVEGIESLSRWLKDNEDAMANAEGNSSKNSKEIKYAVNNLNRAIYDLQKWLKSKRFMANERRSILLEGRAGVGKSHLLAHFAEQAMENNHPVIFLLGQHFIAGEPTEQIRRLLDVQQFSWEVVLSALDKAAWSARRRGVIVIDALNEGKGIDVWPYHLDGLMGQVLRYPHLTLVVGCRSEYVKYIFPEGFSEKVVQVSCRGFESPKEIDNASRIYLDKRGINRPATPWLAPEFTNPLFLRTCCLALAKDGKKEFPLGLNGVKKVLRFYLDNIQSRMTSLNKLVPRLPDNSVQRLFLYLAGRMAEKQDNWLSGEEVLAGIGRVLGVSWSGNHGSLLDILREEGALLDIPIPRLVQDSTDPLIAPETGYVFAFQRFGDHLIAETLLKSIDNPEKLFASDGPLLFLVERCWYWQGLIEALSIQIPEKFSGKELMDLIPLTKIKNMTHDLISAFENSLLWRLSDKKSFSEKTLKLFNSHLAGGWSDKRISVLIRLSVLPDHPWGKILGDYLRKRKMPERDAFWSVQLANSDDETHPIYGLIDWALGSEINKASRETLELAAIPLCWSLSTSHRVIRDRATKALTNLFLAQPSLIVPVLRDFTNVDDLYVVERVYASVYGAVLLGMPDNQLTEISKTVFELIFADGYPIPHILLREYASGIIEKAVICHLFPTSLNIALARPPWKSQWPLESVDEEYIKKTKKDGAFRILNSVTSPFGDFGIYSVTNRLRHFSKISLDSVVPETVKQKFERFFSVVCAGNGNEQKLAALNELVSVIKSEREEPVSVNFKVIGGRECLNTFVEGDDQEFSDTKDVQAEATFLKLLNELEVKLYHETAEMMLFPYRFKDEYGTYPSMDVEPVKRWIVKRVMEMGWTKERFEAFDGYVPYDDRSRPTVERIGKKYQWIALHEAMARCSDNVYLYSERTHYKNTFQIGGIRDVEVSILPDHDTVKKMTQCGKYWWRNQLPDRLKSMPNEKQWLHDVEIDIFNGTRWIDVADPDGVHWLVLHTFNDITEKLSLSDDFMGLPRRKSWCRINAVLIKKSDLHEAIKRLENNKLTDPSTFAPIEMVDETFFGECFWHPVWKDLECGWEKNESFSGSLLGDISFVRPVVKHGWEGHADKSLSDGVRLVLPSPWLANKMGLTMPSLQPGVFHGSDNQKLFFDPAYGLTSDPTLLVRRDRFRAFLEEQDLACLWIMSGEKILFTDSDVEKVYFNVHSAVYFYDGAKWQGDCWHC